MILEALSKGFDVHFCVSPLGCHLMVGEVFLRHHEVQGAEGLPKVSGPVLFHQQVLRKSSPSHLLKQTAPARQREPGAGVRMCSSHRWRRRSVPVAHLKNHGGLGQSAVGTEQNRSLVCAGFIQKQNQVLEFYNKVLKKKNLGCCLQPL